MPTWICVKCGRTMGTNDPKRPPLAAGCKDKSGKPAHHSWKIKK